MQRLLAHVFSAKGSGCAPGPCARRPTGLRPPHTDTRPFAHAARIAWLALLGLTTLSTSTSASTPARVLHALLPTACDSHVAAAGVDNAITPPHLATYLNARGGPATTRAAVLQDDLAPDLKAFNGVVAQLGSETSLSVGCRLPAGQELSWTRTSMSQLTLPSASVRWLGAQMTGDATGFAVNTAIPLLGLEQKLRLEQVSLQQPFVHTLTGPVAGWRVDGTLQITVLRSKSYYRLLASGMGVRQSDGPQTYLDADEIIANTPGLGWALGGIVAATPPGARWQWALSAEPLAGAMAWRDATRRQLSLNTNTQGIGNDGYIEYLPLITGRMQRGSLSVPFASDLSVALQSTPQPASTTSPDGTSHAIPTWSVRVAQRAGHWSLDASVGLQAQLGGSLHVDLTRHQNLTPLGQFVTQPMLGALPPPNGWRLDADWRARRFPLSLQSGLGWGANGLEDAAGVSAALTLAF